VKRTVCRIAKRTGVVRKPQIRYSEKAVWNGVLLVILKKGLHPMDSC